MTQIMQCIIEIDCRLALEKWFQTKDEEGELPNIDDLLILAKEALINVIRDVELDEVHRYDWKLYHIMRHREWKVQY